MKNGVRDRKLSPKGEDKSWTKEELELVGYVTGREMEGGDAQRKDVGPWKFPVGLA